MKAEAFLDALAYLDDEFLSELDELLTEKKKHAKKNTRKSGRTLLIAAALATMMGAVAYAADLFGFGAILLKDKANYLGEEYAQISLSQPQGVPEDVDAALAGKLANSRAAWAEWQEYQSNQPSPKTPACYENEPEGTYAFEIKAKGDGTGTAVYYAEDKTVLKETPLSPEEYAECEAFQQFCLGVSGYDTAYGVRTDDASAKIEEIAVKYGLALRRERHILWSSETTGQTGDRFLLNSQLCEKTAQMGNAGNIFRTTPIGFDKLYWFDEGSFAVSYSVALPKGGTADCYAYNSMYSTLSSGKEVINWEEDLSTFFERSYKSSDGTTVTILSCDNSAYLYVYRDKSFFAMRITADAALTEEDINLIADGLHYSLIGEEKK